MNNSIITNLTNGLEATKDWLLAEFAKVRTGRATPSFLDSVQVTSYGALVPLNQVASVTVEDSKTLRISPWDSSLIREIETAIAKADLGVSTSVDEKGIRLHFPDLTEETRQKIAKSAKQKHEEARIRVRSLRDDARSSIQTDQKASDLSEDEAKRLLDSVEDLVSKSNKSFDDLYDSKYQELTTI